MGWGRTLFLGDIGNRLDIQDAENEIGRLKQELAAGFHHDLSQDDKISMLIAENAELKLYLAALIRVLAAKGAITKEELQRLVTLIDSADGSADGTYGGKII